MEIISNQDIISDQVQKYFLTLLKQIGLKYTSVIVNNNSERSKHLVSTIANVIVKDGENKEHNFIVKSAPKDTKYRAFIQSTYLFDREMYVYNKTLFEFSKFQKEANVSNPFASYPQILGSIAEDMHEAIIMQDMTAIGYKMLDATLPLDYEHVMIIMKEYGKLHALSYALRDQNPETFLELSNNLQEGYFSGQAWVSLKPVFHVTLTRAFETIDPLKHKTVHQKYSKFLKHIDESVRRVLNSENAGEYAVIGHGDCWINNILIKYKDFANSKVPTNICIIDWQFSRLGSPALDLSYFLFTSTDCKTRKQHFKNFIKEYHNSVCSFYTELTGNSQICLPYNILEEHLRKFSIYGLFLGLQALYLMLNTPKDGSDTKKSKGMENFIYESDNMTEFNERAKDVILDFNELGYDMY